MAIKMAINGANSDLANKKRIGAVKFKCGETPHAIVNRLYTLNPSFARREMKVSSCPFLILSGDGRDHAVSSRDG